jgi:uncharacterized protein (TIGR00299 family) protein
MNTLWVHPFNGIAGDMMLGALLDAGADAAEVTTMLSTLGVDGWELQVESIFRSGIGATNVQVMTDEGHVHRTAGDIIALVESADLPVRVVERAGAVFRALAKAEGHIHRQDPDTVHFHEVGGIDAIVDVVGVCCALELLEIDELVIGPVAVGRGMVRSAHGRIPNPAPATVELLAGWEVKGLETPIELTTPTGAAIVAALGSASGPMPAMTVAGSGFGAGDAEPDDFPNLLQVVLGQRATVPAEMLTLLETNVDDATGEILGHTLEQLMTAGALDAWITPILMKKGRPAHTVSVLAVPDHAATLSSILLAETGSIGVRRTHLERDAAERRIEMVVVDGHEVRVKVTAHRCKAEHDDAVVAAAALDMPVREVAARAEQLWRDSAHD